MAFLRVVGFGRLWSDLKGGPRAIEAMIAGLESAMKSRSGRNDIADAHRRVAHAMRYEVLQAYDERVEGRQRVSYRRGKHLGGKALKRALQKDGMFVGDEFGVGMIDRGILDAEAAHWYRLNFGAAPATVPPARRYPVRITSATEQHTKALGFNFRPSSEPMEMPGGFFVNGRGRSTPFGESRGQEFRPTSRSFWLPTQGIEARRFLDEAFVALSTQLPFEYEQLMEYWIEKGRRAGGVYLRRRP